MNRQTFSEYLEQPSKLYQLPLTELQGLVLAYPYSANLRQLLYLKAKLENHPRAEEILQQAAARTFDRAYLYELVQSLERDGLESLGQQEKLELQDLDKLSFELMPAEEATRDKGSVIEAADLYPSTPPTDFSTPPDEADVLPDFSDGVIVGASLATLSPGKESEDEVDEADPTTLEVGDVIDLSPEAVASPAYQHDMGTAVTISELISRFFQPIVVPDPVPAQDILPVRTRTTAKLSDRLKRHKKLQLDRLNSQQPFDDLGQNARKSVSQYKEIASETLAQLLVRQGQYEKAIKMYKRLGLLYPEKKLIFAGLITDLKEKL
ncbi:MAG: hypothetical protein AAF828_03270 [Bacteroidota bacterium]